MPSQSDYALQILIQLGVIGADDLKAVNELAKSTGPEFEKSMGVINVSQQEANKITDETLEKGEKLRLDKRELSEILRQLGPQFAEVGELGRLAFNPITLAVGGLLLGLEAIHKVQELIAEDLTQIKMPDFDLEKVGEASRAWHGLADAIQAANDKISGPEGIYKRSVAALEEQLKFTKELNKEQENAALGELEKQKASLDPEEYGRRKKVIENTFADKDRLAENQTTTAELARKFEEAKNLKSASDLDKQRADAIKLPENDKDVESQIEKQKARLATLSEEIKKREENLQFISKVDSDRDTQNFETIADRLKFFATYGGNVRNLDTTVAASSDFERRSKVTDEESSKAVNVDIENRERLLEERRKLREKAASEGGQAADLYGELPQAESEAKLNQVINVLNLHGGKTNMALGDLAATLRMSEQAKLNMVERILNHSLEFADAYASLEHRLAQLESQSNRAGTYTGPSH